ncbi:PH domain-containing protein [Leptolyngbya sp. FACHB-261]|uniref:PH domain-containing protein n=1 Tax=Leptolyngbya sp. FACHB-261 TaxID=2692806 RepID=UPI0016876F26|nr:PH domain-containing protein [Leptolyngbya sp. FACHB-261]MBD2103848.1 PH domain-containing protein [Leptolyngbya sp. FACHB-261]
MAIKEDVYLESGPHVGDLVLNIVLAFTVICIPLTIGSIVRALWVRYRITSRRITVTGGWRGQNRSDIIYSEIAKIITVPRGFGAWGDMVITLKDGSRLELKALPNFREVYAYIEERLSNSARQASGSLGKVSS